MTALRDGTEEIYAKLKSGKKDEEKVSLTKGDPKKLNGVEFAPMTLQKGDRYNIKYPKLISGASKPVIEMFNAKMSVEAKNLISDQDEIGNGEPSTADQTFELVHQKDGIFSLSVSGSFYGQGAAHPNSFASGLVWDLKSGKLETINLEDKFKNLEKVKSNLIKASSHDFGDLGKVKGNSVKLDCGEEGEDMEIPELVNSMSPGYFSQTGLVFNTSFPHVMEACNKSVTASWALLEKFEFDQAFLKRIKP